jgi:site-specific DNA-methyltransferase (adenine-specific)
MKLNSNTAENSTTAPLLGMQCYMPPSSVFNEDCVQGMKKFPDNYFDLAICDPPYGSSIMAKNKRQRHKTTDTTYRNESAPGKEYFEELYRVSKHQIIFGCQYMLEFMKPEGSFIVWDKKADPDKHNMSSCDIAWYSKRERVRTFHGHWCGAVKFEKEPTIHIHQKPVGLYRWILHHYAKKGMKILDTHLGSGSSRIAAHSMGLEFVGFEIDKTYVERQEVRFKQFLSVLHLPLGGI